MNINWIIYHFFSKVHLSLKVNDKSSSSNVEILPTKNDYINMLTDVISGFESIITEVCRF